MGKQLGLPFLSTITLHSNQCFITFKAHPRLAGHNTNQVKSGLICNLTNKKQSTWTTICETHPPPTGTDLSKTNEIGPSGVSWPSNSNSVIKKLLLRQQENMRQSLATKFSPEVVIGLSVLTFSKKNKKKTNSCFKIQIKQKSETVNNLEIMLWITSINQVSSSMNSRYRCKHLLQRIYIYKKKEDAR